MIDNQAEKISYALREHFRKKKINQEEIARKINVRQQYVSLLLNGKPISAPIAKKLHNAFGFSINWLLTGAGNMFSTSKKPEEMYSDNANQILKLKNELIEVLKNANNNLQIELDEKKSEIQKIKKENEYLREKLKSKL